MEEEGFKGNDEQDISTNIEVRLDTNVHRFQN